MWLRWKPAPDGALAITAGRQSFSDDREWWWDEDLDAIRLHFKADNWAAELAVARELAPTSTLDDQIDPAEEKVLRVLGHTTWDWYPNHRLEGFVLYQNDFSTTPELGDTIARKDAIDTDITWLGLRASGKLSSPDYGTLAYRVEGARIVGHEHILTFTDVNQELVVSERRRQEIRGWALDLGLNWQPLIKSEPNPVLWLCNQFW